MLGGEWSISIWLTSSFSSAFISSFLSGVLVAPASTKWLRSGVGGLGTGARIPPTWACSLGASEERQMYLYEMKKNIHTKSLKYKNCYKYLMITFPESIPSPASVVFISSSRPATSLRRYMHTGIPPSPGASWAWFSQYSRAFHNEPCNVKQNN